MNTQISPMWPCIRSATIALVAGVLWQVSVIALAEPPLNLEKAPSFLISPLSNVFWQLDDSASTDWDILTVPHWFACFYDISAKSINTFECQNISTTGMYVNGSWMGYRGNPSAKQLQEYKYISKGKLNYNVNTCGGNNVGDLLTTVESCTVSINGKVVNEVLESDWRLRSPSFNVMYYNPLVTYEPWSRKPQSTLTKELVDAKFNAAKNDPLLTTAGQGLVTKNLSGFVYNIWEDDKGYEGDGCNKPDGDQDSSDNECDFTSPFCGPTPLNSIPNSPNLMPKRGKDVNYTKCPNKFVDLWDSYKRVIVTDSELTVDTYKCDPDRQKLNLSPFIQPPPLCSAVSRKKYTGAILPPELGGRSLDNERKNIANWYQFARRRVSIIKGVTGLVVNNNPNYRYGVSSFSYPNKPNSSAKPSGFFQAIPKHDEILEEYNRDFLDNFYKNYQPVKDSRFTPLLEALHRVGEYFNDKSSNGGKLGQADVNWPPIIADCQRNFAILISEGLWNDSKGLLNFDKGDQDGDGFQNILSDIAKYYYTTDLSGRPNKVPADTNDLPPSSTGSDDLQNYPHRQRLVTHTVSFGIRGTLEDIKPKDGWPDEIVKPLPDGPWVSQEKIKEKEKSGSWMAPFTLTPDDIAAGRLLPKAASSSQVIINDMWHAAYNSRGIFSSADSPQDLMQALQAAMSSISAKATAAPPAASAGVIINAAEGVKVFQARFSSEDWSGHLCSVTLKSDGSLDGEDLCDDGVDVSRELHEKDWNKRIIITSKPRDPADPASPLEGIPFQWRDLTPAQKEALRVDVDSQTQPQTLVSDSEGEARLEFIRGRGVIPDSNTNDPWIISHNFGKRSSKLGDIIHSAPIYVAEPPFNYPPTLEAKDYAAFRQQQKGRTPVIYVGANDGMLHGFVASQGSSGEGEEKLAYIPSELIGKLNVLTLRDYRPKDSGSRREHENFVDGSSTISDAFIKGDWRTVLVGTLRGGGQSVFALDITDPDNFKESQANKILLWEFTDGADSSDNPPGTKHALGYTYSKPTITRMANKEWVAIFGNGYNNTENDGSASETGNAVLYIVKLEDGQLLRKIDTGVGFGSDSQRPNGLATPAVVDVDNDFAADYVYAGDLFGNLWKFDVRSDNPNDWAVAPHDVNGSSTPQPLFKAVGPDGQRQPITSAPVVDFHPLGTDYGYMVYFGTGKLIYKGDNDIRQTQSLYGIWDTSKRDGNDDEEDERKKKLLPLKKDCVFTASGTRTDRSQVDCNPEPVVRDPDPEILLLEQKITLEEFKKFEASGESTEFNIRLTSDEPIIWFENVGGVEKIKHRGWYMDLTDVKGNNRGEQIISEPALRNKRIIFNTMIALDSCNSTSWMMMLDATDGGPADEQSFDLNGDGRFTDADLVTITENGVPRNQPVSGWQSRVGIFTSPSLITSGNGIITVICGSSGNCEVRPPLASPGDENIGRQSWRQLY